MPLDRYLLLNLIIPSSESNNRELLLRREGWQSYIYIHIQVLAQKLSIFEIIACISMLTSSKI